MDAAAVKMLPNLMSLTKNLSNLYDVMIGEDLGCDIQGPVDHLLINAGALSVSTLQMVGDVGFEGFEEMMDRLPIFLKISNECRNLVEAADAGRTIDMPEMIIRDVARDLFRDRESVTLNGKNTKTDFFVTVGKRVEYGVEYDVLEPVQDFLPKVKVRAVEVVHFLEMMKNVEKYSYKDAQVDFGIEVVEGAINYTSCTRDSKNTDNNISSMWYRNVKKIVDKTKESLSSNRSTMQIRQNGGNGTGLMIADAINAGGHARLITFPQGDKGFMVEFHKGDEQKPLNLRTQMLDGDTGFTPVTTFVQTVFPMVEQAA
jgi:hypothetical protein